MPNQYTANPFIDMSDLNRNDFTKQQWDAKWHKRYGQTDRAKIMHKRYEQTPAGRMSRENIRKTYRQSTNGIETEKQYRCSEEGKAVQKRYANTEKGKVSIKRKRDRYNHSIKGKAMQKARQNERRAHKINAKPAWYNASKVYKIYLQSRRKTVRTGRQYSVDHIVPLQGKTVCGLHVEGNLRVILLDTNLRKQEKFTPATERLIIRKMARDQARNNC